MSGYVMRTLENYMVVLRPDDNGTFVAYIPAIVGCHALGQTPDEARSELVNVFDMIRDEYQEEGKLLPNDVEVAVVHDIGNLDKDSRRNAKAIS
jgi:predicted RNase H-like HicB family nuclease